MKDQITTRDIYLYLHFVLKNSLFDKIKSKYFSDAPDIEKILEIILKHKKEFGDLPSQTTIRDYLIKDNYEIKEELLNRYLNPKGYVDEDEKNPNFIKTKFNDFIKLKKYTDYLYEQIDKSRNGKISEIDESFGITNIEEEEIKLPLISQDIYDNLPQVLKDLTKPFEGRTRDVLLTSLLSTISIFFSNVKSHYYQGNEIYNNIYTLVVANSAMGKSIMKKAPIILHDLIHQNHEDYLKKKNYYNLLSAEDKKNTDVPVESVLVFGGDTTRPALIKYLLINNGKMLMFDTEADSLTDNKKSDYGDLTTFIRKGIGNEQWVKVIKTEESVFIPVLKNNICISGTPDQVPKLIGTEGGNNGTLNRFIIYIWDEEPVLIDPHINIGSNDNFKQIGSKLNEFYHKYFTDEDCFVFELTEDQKLKFFNKISTNHSDILNWEDNSVDGILKRHYLYAKKLMITFTCLRLFELGYSNDLFNSNEKMPNVDLYKELNRNIEISDDDFDTIFKLIEIYIKHSIHAFNPFIKDKDIVNKKSWKKELFDLLPKEFSRTDLVQLGKKYNRSIRTIDRWVKNLKENDQIESTRLNYRKKI